MNIILLWLHDSDTLMVILFFLVGKNNKHQGKPYNHKTMSAAKQDLIIILPNFEILFKKKFGMTHVFYLFCYTQLMS